MSQRRPRNCLRHVADRVTMLLGQKTTCLGSRQRTTRPSARQLTAKMDARELRPLSQIQTTGFQYPVLFCFALARHHLEQGSGTVMKLTGTVLPVVSSLACGLGRCTASASAHTCRANMSVIHATHRRGSSGRRIALVPTYLSHLEPAAPCRPEHFALADAH
jgi:hypothetical protein